MNNKFMLCMLCLVFSFNSCSSPRVSLPEYISLLVPIVEEETGALFWNKANWFLENGEIITSAQNILLEPHPDKLSPMLWDGATNFYHARPYAQDRGLLMDEASFSIAYAPYNASNHVSYQSFGAEEQVLVYLPVYSERNNECIVEFFGKNPRKLTLHPNYEQYPHLRILSPVAIQKEVDRYSFYFKTVLSRSEGSLFGIIEATFDGREVKWSIFSLDLSDIGFNAQSSVALFHNHFYIANSDGSVWKLNLKSKKSSKEETLSRLLQVYATTHPSLLTHRRPPEFFVGDQLAVLRWHSVEKYDAMMDVEATSIILVFQPKEVLLQLLSSAGRSHAYVRKGKTNEDGISVPSVFPDPVLWIFPQGNP